MEVTEDVDPKVRSLLCINEKDNLNKQQNFDIVGSYMTPGPDVMKLFSCSYQLNMKF